MSEDSKPPTTMASSEIFGAYTLRHKDSKSDKIDMSAGTSYEVFRNNTTAIEVIVKEVPNKFPKSNASQSTQQQFRYRKMQRDIDDLKDIINRAHQREEMLRNGFRKLVFEMRNQLESATQRELDRQTKNLALELENEKLRMLVEAKSNLVLKMKKEFVWMKRVLKFVVKSICNTPQIPSSVTFSSEAEYEHFEKDLKNATHPQELKAKFALNMFDLPILHGHSNTFDSSATKDAHSFEK